MKADLGWRSQSLLQLAALLLVLQAALVVEVGNVTQDQRLLGNGQDAALHRRHLKAGGRGKQQGNEGELEMRSCDGKITVTSSTWAWNWLFSSVSYLDTSTSLRTTKTGLFVLPWKITASYLFCKHILCQCLFKDSFTIFPWAISQGDASKGKSRHPLVT